MKTLVIADRPPKISIAEILCEHPDIELIITLGDLEIRDIGELQNITDIPKIGVYGNHCSGNYFEELGILNMHLATFQFRGILFGGFEGCVRYKESEYAKMYTQEEASDVIRNMPPVDVLVCHCPPFGVNDHTDIAHIGYLATRWYCDTYRPKLLLHGHTYPENPVTHYGQTKIQYVHGYQVIDI